MATIPFPAPTRHLISVDAFHRMGEAGILGPGGRVELIDGEIIDRSPIGVLHAALVARLASWFSQKLGRAAVVWCQNPLRLDDLSEPEPDIAILRPQARLDHPPAGCCLRHSLGTGCPSDPRNSLQAPGTCLAGPGGPSWIAENRPGSGPWEASFDVARPR